MFFISNYNDRRVQGMTVKKERKKRMLLWRFSVLTTKRKKSIMEIHCQTKAYVFVRSEGK